MIAAHRMGLNVYHIKLELCKYFVNASEYQVTRTCAQKIKKRGNFSFLVQPISYTYIAIFELKGPLQFQRCKKPVRRGRL